MFDTLQRNTKVLPFLYENKILILANKTSGKSSIVNVMYA